MMEQTGTDDMPTWPDALEAPAPAAVEALLHTFWDVLTQVVTAWCAPSCCWPMKRSVSCAAPCSP
ncbi:MAG: hypothetical protein R2838_15740 [Caldilineaceae bacterium]